MCLYTAVLTKVFPQKCNATVLIGIVGSKSLALLEFQGDSERRKEKA